VRGLKFSVIRGKHHPATWNSGRIASLTTRNFAALKRPHRGEITAIKAGRSSRHVKKAVILAAGYPPRSPRIDQVDTRKYWRHRFGSYSVRFSNGKVAKSEQ
jgi:hypothetical protein